MKRYGGNKWSNSDQLARQYNHPDRDVLQEFEVNKDKLAQVSFQAED